MADTISNRRIVIPEPYDEYYQIDDTDLSTSDYQLGDLIDGYDCKFIAYLEPRSKYSNSSFADSYPILTDDPDYPVCELVGGRLIPVEFPDEDMVFDDEFDEEEFALKKIDDSTAIVNGKTYIDDLNEELDINLESENSETVGGLVMELLGEIPADGDKGRVVEYKNYRFTVLSVADRRIEKIKMEILPPEESVEESED